MTLEQILQLRNQGEDTTAQFKERIIDKYDVACELVAMSNTKGGLLVVGVNDKSGSLNPLSYQEVQETTALLADMASENVIPGILLDIDSIATEGGSIVVANVKEGLNKPYHDNKAIVWVKNGADKRKVFDNAELAEMMTECGSFNPDEAAVRNATIDDLDEQTLKLFLLNRFEAAITKGGIDEENMRFKSLEEMVRLVSKGFTPEKLLRNLHLIRPDGQMTVAAMLLFGKYPQRWMPVFTAKCIHFDGNFVGGNVFVDKMPDYEMEGNLLHQYNTIMAFLRRNLRTVQVEREFNSPGKLEIPYVTLVEFVVNALVHRSLNWKAPIRIFIFDNRVELHSPGELPNGLSVDDILAGTSMPRNALLFENAIHLLPYTGAGSGIPRAMEPNPHVTFTSDDHRHEFIVTINLTEGQLVPAEEVRRLKEMQQAEHQEMHQVKHQVKHQVEHQELHQELHQEKSAKRRLSKEEKDIVNFCSIPRTAQEILNREGVINTYRARRKYITPLLDLGLLEMTIPENPRDRNQKYRKVIRKNKT